MEFFKSVVDIFLHLDTHLNAVAGTYGTWTYLLLFLIVFCETGLVVTPFLPGDSLLFAAGALAAIDGSPISVGFLFVLLVVAAIAGDTVNYWVGNFVGPRVFHQQRIPFLKKEHLEKTNRFYEKYGGKTIILARFIPIIRTFAPFVAGIGSMNYARFILYNVVGGIVWVALFLYAGYLFGQSPIVEHNFTLVILAIIAISLVPPVIEFVRSRRSVGAAS
ncbi:MAG: DedA family protein [Chloroflexota bacterium]|nr:DedA family protein [Chloroflexota bacterium]PLS82556.1 MAG: DedA family protein [Chloroflexota bacterium]